MMFTKKNVNNYTIFNECIVNNIYARCTIMN